MITANGEVEGELAIRRLALILYRLPEGSPLLPVQPGVEVVGVRAVDRVAKDRDQPGVRDHIRHPRWRVIGE